LLDGAEYGKRGHWCGRWWWYRSDEPLLDGADMAGADTDVGDDDDVDDLDEMLWTVESEFSGKNKNDKFSQIMKDYETPLFSGCKKEHNKLYVVLTLLQMKASNDWSDKGFNELLQFLNDLLPKPNVLPQSTYQAKKIVCLLGLEVKKIHACQNECILYHNEDAMLGECRVCETSWYKRNDKNIDEDDMGENKKVKRVPAKVAWYFPIIPHLWQLFVNKANAELLQWHAREHKKDAMLCHLANGIQWRNFDRKHKDVAGEVRNIRFGLSTDAMNPFGEIGNSHSTWPITLCIYNLPSYFCMKRKLIMMTLLISGLVQISNDIDVYLHPLIDYLLVLWKKGV
jgi:hypothetical protein